MSSSYRNCDAKSFRKTSDWGLSSSRIIGEGETAELIRAFDWAKTPVGPVETWSDTLLTTVNLLLASRHPMFLWWGPELIQFYNDGYRPTIRADKHPLAVGQRGKECWPEIWPIIGPQIEAVMTRGESSWNKNHLVPINRNGKLEEVFWTYGYSPVRDKSGSVQGTLVVCSETTEQVLSERRLRALLAITTESAERRSAPQSRPFRDFAQRIAKKLHGDTADLPFAALYLLNGDEISIAGSTVPLGEMANPEHWPLRKVADSQAPLLVEDLQQRFGNIILEPWPEPVTRAYLLPMSNSGSPIQTVLLFGVSPRLPFDNSYQTFFQLLGARIADLLQSEIHRIERAKAAERFHRLTEANPFGTIIGDLHGRLKYVNPEFLKTLGYLEEDVSSGKIRWDDLTPPEYAEADARAVEQIRAYGRCDLYEKAYIAKDGRRIPIVMGAAMIDSAESDHEIAAFVTDLTPLKIAEEALRTANDELERKVTERTAALEAEILDLRRAEIHLRELTGRLLSMQDEERRHMARELHDHAGQTLTALGLNLSVLGKAAKNLDPKVSKLAAESQQLSDDLSKEIRTLSYLLHPPLLDEVGLGSALRWYVDGFSARSKIKVDLDLPVDITRLPKPLELVLFRIVQESLTNVHRHSGSSSAKINLKLSNDTVELVISDQGKGISSERAHELSAASTGVGVRGMEERVRQFNGTFELVSDHIGAKVVVVLPVKPEAA